MDGLENFKDCIHLSALQRRSDEKKKRRWGRSLCDTEIPKYQDLRKFLTNWIISLENDAMREKHISKSKSTNSKSNPNGKKVAGRRELSVNATYINKDAKCSLWKGGNTLATCRKFQELPS